MHELRSLVGEFAYLEMDTIRLAEFPESNSGENRARAYARMHELAAEALRSGDRGVILNATYQPRQQRSAVVALAMRLDARLLILELKVSADLAVTRFLERPSGHAASDLTAERVWDLAQDFPYFGGAAELDTTPLPEETGQDSVNRSVGRVLAGLLGAEETRSLQDWIGHAPPASPPPVTSSGPLLNEKSRARASRESRRRRRVRTLVALMIVVAAGVALKAALDSYWPIGWNVRIDGEAASWVQVWFLFAGVPAAWFGLRTLLFDSDEARRDTEVMAAGSVPRMELTNARPPNDIVYRRYRRRIREDQVSRMPIEGVPLWFLIPPDPGGFDVLVRDGRKLAKYQHALTVKRNVLEREAGLVGLDWRGYVAWRTDEVRKRYVNDHKEDGIRALDVKVEQRPVEVVASPSDFFTYICTEESADYVREGSSSFEMRQILEGKGWLRSNSLGSAPSLDLGDVRGASERFEMRVSAQVALTTEDGFLVLQRRSHFVHSAGGGIGASGAGACQWRDLRFGGSLVEGARREILEEIGWKGAVPERPFLGAAFNLLRGRDLNFYCHFHTKRKFADVSAGMRRRPRWLMRRNRDTWEVAHLIPVPVEAVGEDGSLLGNFKGLLGDSRHVRGLLYCLARGDRFLDLQSEFKRRGRIAVV